MFYRVASEEWQAFNLVPISHFASLTTKGSDF